MNGFIKEVCSSFYDPLVYRDVAREKGGIGATYILFLTGLTLLVTFIFLVIGYEAAKDDFNGVPAIVASLPAATLKDGKLSIDKPVPYVIAVGTGADAAHIVIDTDYKVADLGALHDKMKQEKMVVLITQDAIISPDQHDELKIKELKDFQSFEINHDGWQKLAKVVKDWGVTIVVWSFLIFGFIGVFLFNLIATFCTAVIAALVGAVTKAGLEFDGSMRIAALLRIPATMLAFVISYVGLEAHSTLLGWLLWIAYLLFAVLSNKQKTPV